MARDDRSIVLVGAMGGLFLAAMDATVLSVAMPSIVEDLGGGDLYAWGFTTYMLAAAVSMPVLGALSDRHGRQRVFLLMLGVFVAGSIACGLSPNMPTFLASRVVQGIGGGGMLSIPFALGGALFTGSNRARVLSRFASVWGVAAVAGPLVGAAATRFLSWEWVFYVNIPVGLAGAWLVARHRVDEPRSSAPPVDVTGAALLMTGVAGLLLSIEEQVTNRPAFLLGGGALLGAFFWREREARAPILPMHLLTRRPILVANVAAMLAAIAIFAPIAFVPRFVENAYWEGASVAAALPLSVGWSTTAMLVGRHLETPRRIHAAALAGLALLGSALFVAPSLMTWGLATIALSSYLFGVGMGLNTPALLLTAQNAAPVTELGVVTGSQTFLRSVGGAVGIVALGTLLVEGAEQTLGGISPSLQGAGLVAAAGAVLVLALGRVPDA